MSTKTVYLTAPVCPTCASRAVVMTYAGERLNCRCCLCEREWVERPADQQEQAVVDGQVEVDHEKA